MIQFKITSGTGTINSRNSSANAPARNRGGAIKKKESRPPTRG